MSQGRDERIARAIVEAMRTRTSDPRAAFGPDRCDRCGSEEYELFWMISPSGGLVLVDDVCGDLCRCIPTPPCPPAAGHCGATAGKPCEPGCSSRAAATTWTGIDAADAERAAQH